MIDLELKYIPSLRNILPIPPLFAFRGTARKVGGRAFVSTSSDAFRFRFDNMDQAVEAASALASARNDRASSDLSVCFPFAGMAWESGSPPAGELWRLVPAGHMIFPGSLDFSGGSEWMYGWDIICLGAILPVSEALTPIPSMLVTGQKPYECFFCGSHWHGSEACPLMFSPTRKFYSVRRLSKIAPSYWLEHLKKSTVDRQVITAALGHLKHDMRAIFTWRHAARLCRSSASLYRNVASSPLKDINATGLKDIFRAIETGSLPQINTAIKLAEGRETDRERTGLGLLKGFYLLSAGLGDRAGEIWWQAEREAATPARKVYAALLQARLCMTGGDLAGAAGAVRRALDTEKTPETVYWAMVVDAMQGKRGEVLNAFRRLESCPEYFCSALAEPMLLRLQPEIEASFRSIWKQRETAVMEQVGRMEKMLDQAGSALGEEMIQDVAIKLRDWRGGLSQMGYSSLLEADRFLKGLEKDVMAAVNRQFRATMQRFASHEKRCRAIVERLPAGGATGHLRKKGLGLIRRMRELAADKKVKKIHKLEGFYEEIRKVLQEYEDFNREYEDYLHKAWKKRMLLKLLIYGTLVSFVLWSVMYVYETWFK